MSEKTRCSICNHPRSGEIAAALIAGEPQRTVAERFGVAKSSLCRHVKRHTFSEALARRRKVLVPKRRRKKTAAQVDEFDVGVVLREIVQSIRDLRDSEADAGRSNSVAALSQALLRTIEVIGKREERGAGQNARDAGLNKMAKVLEEWPWQMKLLVLGRCPRCDEMLACPRHGPITEKEICAFVQIRAVADYPAAGEI